MKRLTITRLKAHDSGMAFIRMVKNYNFDRICM